MISITMNNFMYLRNGTLLPHFAAIPIDFTTSLPITIYCSTYTQLISNIDIKSCEIRILSSRFELDLYIGFIATSVSIKELCDVVIAFDVDITISKHAVIDILKKHITVTGVETYQWLRNMDKIDYSHYMFMRRNWPYTNKKSEEVRKIGVDLGIIRNNYPCNNVDIHENVYGHREENDIKYREWLAIAKSVTNLGMYDIPDLKNECNYTTVIVEKICAIFMIFNRHELVILSVCTLMTTRKYYHTVMHSAYILNLLNYLMKKHVLIYKIIKYALSYSIYMMVKEERMLGKNILENSRCILSGEVLRALPVFTENEPYMVDTGYKENEKYTPLHLHKAGSRRITTEKEFKSRLSIVAGKALDGIELKKYDASLTGSIIVPCVAVSPLEDNYEKGDFKSFINNYYLPLSAIEPQWNRFEELEKKRHDHLDTLSIDERIEAENTHFNFLKNMPAVGNNEEETIYINYYKAEKEISDMDIGIISLNMTDYTTKVVSIFREIENNLSILLNRKPVIRLCKQPLMFGYKWVLRGKDMIRPIDFFKINISYPCLMTRFHYPIVKFWWDGVELKGLISGACAALTGINLFYKHFNNGKDPIQIALKYLQRGYTTVLNNAENTALQTYVNMIPRYRFIDGMIISRRINSRHILFSDYGGIRYTLNPIPGDYNNTSQNFTIQGYRASRLNIDFIFSNNGHIHNPKVYALETTINDLMDD